MPIRFLNTTGVEDFFVADADLDRVGIGTNSPKQLLHLMKGGITASFTAPESEVLRVQSKAPSELSGTPPASDINIFTDGTNGGYSRIIFTDDQVPYGENGLYYDHTNRYFSIVNKGAAVATATASRGFYCGENHTIGTNDYAFAANDGNVPSGGRAFAAGHLTTASGDISAAFGYDTLASGGASFSIGALTTASGDNSFASGGGSTASGGESAAFGYQTIASGEESFAIGNGTTASGASSFAGGGPTTLAGAPNAFAFGADVDVTGGHSAGFGRLHDIAGTENLVGGLNNVVNGAANLVGGANNDLGSKANNLVAGGSHSFGTDAGDYNTVIGFSNECNDGSYSFIGGQDSFNFGDRSISFGSGTTASTGNQQFAFGEGTTTPTSGSAAYGSNQFVVGKFNIYSTGGRVHLFAVGNGTGPNSRTNAFNVDTLGRVGVNQYSPNYTFDVTGTGRFTGDMYLGRYIFHNGDTNTWMGFPTSDTIGFRTNGSDRMYINSSGNVGIGTTGPGEKLEVNGTVKATATTDAYKGYIKSVVNSTLLMKSANTNYNYIPFNTTIFGTTADYYNRITVPYNGRIKKITLRHIPDSSGTVPTATGLKFKFEKNGSVIATEYTATVIGGASANFLATYNFGNSDLTFTQGDYIGILVQTSGGTGSIIGASAQIVFEYNIT